MSQSFNSENSQVARTDVSPLFRPLAVGAKTLKNRIVMAPMTRALSPNGIPGPDVAEYYRRRAAGGVGLIVTEGTWIPHAAASNDPMVPRFHGDDALEGWKNVADAVHREGGLIVPQLWHIGLAAKSDVAELFSARTDHISEPIGPSGITPSGVVQGLPMTAKQLDEIQQAYVEAAISAFNLGFDGVELHGAHGYLLDQFFWSRTNQREDRYGGSISNRASFVAEIIQQIRRQTAAAFLISLRFSQWKMEDYHAKAWADIDELEMFLAPLTAAGVDLFHCSQRRYWDAEFSGSNLNLAGWTQKLTGKPSISVGSVGIDNEFLDSLLEGGTSSKRGISDLMERMARDEFSLIAIGRVLIANARWPKQVQAGDFESLRVFQLEMLGTLD
jgi:2,4-dienoyl-CoA reductase-like NADH-dependent reductase (Old Yellow Enzyme family)